MLEFKQPSKAHDQAEQNIGSLKAGEHNLGTGRKKKGGKSIEGKENNDSLKVKAYDLKTKGTTKKQKQGKNVEP
jgi:hypothetical protein